MPNRNPVGVFGSSTRTNTLIIISLLGETHASEIAAVLGKSPSRIQDAVASLESAGLLVGIEEGRTRRLLLNPRYPAAAELNALLQSLGRLDVPLQEKLGDMRRRPRRTGKAI